MMAFRLFNTILDRGGGPQGRVCTLGSSSAIEADGARISERGLDGSVVWGLASTSQTERSVSEDG